MAARKRSSFAMLLAGSVRPYVLPVLAATFLSLVALVVFQRLERFVYFNHRFAMATLPPGELPSPSIRVRGANLASEAAIQAVFVQDAGRSVFLVPLAARREAVRQVTWVEQARVSRIWPNRIEVAVTERKPVAFVHLEAARRGQPAGARLIDITGELLPIVRNRRYTLPVLTGIEQRHSRDQRAKMVAVMLRLIEELGAPGKRISEVDLSNPDNVAVVYPTENRAIRLLLGNKEWKSRMAKFMHHYPEIRDNLPGATELDLRLEESIPVTEWEQSDGE